MPKRLRESSPQDIGWQEYNGPWYSDGKFQSSVASYNVPRSYRDVGGHRHDAGAARGGTREQQFQNDKEYHNWMTQSDSWIDWGMGKAVYYGGSYFHTQYTDERPVKRLRGGFDEAAEDEQSPLRNWQEEAEVARVWGARGGGGGEDMADTQNGPARGTQGEVGLIPFKKAAYIQPTYTTASFKWNAHWNFTSNILPWELTDEGIRANNIALNKYPLRANSPLDPLYQVSGPGSNQNRSCNGWNEYRRRYKWYRLIKNRVKVTIQFSDPSGNLTSASTLVANQENQGKRDEISKRSAIPWAAGVSINPGNRYPYMSNNVSGWQQLAQAKFTDWTFARVGETKVFSFDYEPGKWDAIVAEQQKETFWTKTSEAPPLFDTFVVWTQTLEAKGVANWHVTVEMDFTCQFREWTDATVARMLLFDTKAEDYTEADPGFATTSDYQPDMGN